MRDPWYAAAAATGQPNGWEELSQIYTAYYVTHARIRVWTHPGAGSMTVFVKRCITSDPFYPETVTTNNPLRWFEDKNNVNWTYVPAVNAASHPGMVTMMTTTKQMIGTGVEDWDNWHTNQTEPLRQWFFHVALMGRDQTVAISETVRIEVEFFYVASGLANMNVAGDNDADAA